MEISIYTKKVIQICVVLLIAIIGLSFALYTQGPRVRYVQGIEDVQNTSLTTGSSIQIVFDRPIEQRRDREYIRIVPEVDYTAQTNTQSITLTFLNNLQSDTEYTVTLMPEIYDKSGKKMKDAYEYEFRTAEPRYAYLERNYGVNSSSESSFSNTVADVDDHIKRATVGGEPEILFSHPQIRSFAINNKYLVVAAKTEITDQLFTINLETNEVRKERLQPDGRVNNLSLGPRSVTALYTMTPDYTAVSPQYYDEYAGRVHSLNLEDGSMLGLRDISGNPLKAFSVDVDGDGQIALIQDQEAYYAVSPFNDFDPVLIGSYSDTFGFAKRGTEIIFRDRNDFVRYDIVSATVSPIELDSEGYIAGLTSSDSMISYSSTIGSFGGDSFSRVERFSEWGDDPENVWSTDSDQTAILRKFKPSYDNRFLALQFNPDRCQFDTIGTNSECKDVFMQVFDSESRQTLDEFRGSSAVWLP